MTANVTCTVKARRLLRNPHSLSAGPDSHNLPVETYNLNSKVPKQTHQVHHLASRTAFSNNLTSHRKTAVLLKLSNLTFAELLTSMGKI